MNLSDFKQRFGNFFREGTKESMMRLATFICVCGGIIYPFIAHLIKGHIDSSDVAWSLGALGIGITGKVYQKSKEKVG